MPPSPPPFCRRLAAALALALALVLASTGEAQAREHARLRFTRTEGLDTCPSEEDLRGAIVARLGYDPFDGDETAPLLRIRFVRRAPAGGRSLSRVARLPREQRLRGVDLQARPWSAVQQELGVRLERLLRGRGLPLIAAP
ncbi:hypothetical protein BH11MYX4_BH11MYX4_16100 [soil metagenome]